MPIKTFDEGGDFSPVVQSEIIPPSNVGVEVGSGLKEAIDEVKRITKAVFSSPFQIRERDDCESDDRHFEISLVDRGAIPEILARNDEWHRRLLLIPADVRGLFRLSIDAQD